MSHLEYGPLASIIGVWKGGNGTDVAPEPNDGIEHNPYSEVLTCEPAGDVFNASKQKLWAVRYHQTARRLSDNTVLHDQVGYWMWDAVQKQVVQSLTIPRAVCILAGGISSTDSNGTLHLDVSATDGDAHWGIIQSPFMDNNAKTSAYRYQLSVEDDVLTYSQSILLEIYGKFFDHTDGNTLLRFNHP
ncbi:MAG: heme-binding beta-barrel domain-containing protein [Porticoccus sp.]|nr:heme-binding beta-barrel domain-containing protein [Porticoccus sp.]